MPETLHLPPGINYECTGCGTCCSGWAVHMTQEDHTRIASVDWGALHAPFKGKVLFKELQKYEKMISPYTHKIRSDDGTCPFLVNKLCFMHSTNGAEFKPSICQLFPYCFTDTPTGTYATVSFVSVGAVYNSGKALADQREYLEKKLADFRAVFPGYKPDWSKIQLTAGHPLTWDEYLKHEEVLLNFLSSPDGNVLDKLRKCSDYLVERVNQLTAPANKSASEDGAMGLNKLDRHILANFHRMYFPAKGRKINEKGLNTFKFWLGVIFNTGTVFELPHQFYAIDQLREFPFPEDKEVDEIFTRYAYSHVFGKKYFGPGFGGLTVISGFHHLVTVIMLARLHARAVAKARNAPIVSLLDVLATIRMLETQLGETMFSQGSTNTVELLLQSGKRAKRLLSIG